MALQVSGSSTPSPPTSFFAVSVENRGNIFGDATSGACLGQPIMFRRRFYVEAEGTDRVYVGNPDRNLNGSQIYADGFHNGDTADVYIMTNGVRSRIASAEVTATKVNLVANVTPTSSGNAGKVTTTTFQWLVEDYMRPSVGYWFRVAAVDGSGGVGTYSGWVQFTSPASGLGVGTASNTVSARGGSGTSGLAAPTSVAVAAKSGEPAVAEVTWNAVGSATGYLIDISYQDPTLNVTDEYLDIDTSGVTIPEGALVVLTKPVLSPPSAYASRVWKIPLLTTSNYAPLALSYWEPGNTASSWVAYTGGDPAPTGIDGEYFHRTVMPSSGTVARHFFHSANVGNFYEVLEPGRTYKVRFVMRASSSVTATLSVEQVTTGSSTTFNVTTSWQTFEHTFSRSSRLTDNTPYSWSLTVPSAVTVDIAAYETFDNGLEVYDFAPHEKDRASAGSYVRDHTQVKPGARTSSMRQLFNRAGQAARGITLHALLNRCKANDMLPWMQIEWHMPPEDWPDLVAYLAAPANSGHPMADLRVAQGQSTPWVDEFDSLILEFGNEAWNTLSGFWDTVNHAFKDQATDAVSSGKSYGAHVQGCIDAMKGSSYYTALRSKTLFVGGSREATSGQFGIEARSVAADLDGVGYPGYTGGWETVSTVPDETSDSFVGILRFEADFDAAKAENDRHEAVGMFFLRYESGPGYQLNGLGGTSVTVDQVIEQEVVMKSRAMGTATLGAFAMRAAAGGRFDNFFRLQSGNYWTSHAIPGQGGETFPVYGLLKMVWDAVGPCRVQKLNFTTSVTLKDDVEMMQAFKFKSVANPGTQVIAVINRDIDPSLLETDDPLYSATPGGKYLMTVRTGVESCTGLQYYANAGNFREHNRYPVGFRRNSSTNAFDVSDPLCVAITYNWTTGTALTNAVNIQIDDTYGAQSDGLRAGNCVLIKMTGCVP
jgi:hypothetical protein